VPGRVTALLARAEVAHGERLEQVVVVAPAGDVDPPVTIGRAQRPPRAGAEQPLGDFRGGAEPCRLMQRDEPGAAGDPPSIRAAPGALLDAVVNRVPATRLRGVGEVRGVVDEVLVLHIRVEGPLPFAGHAWSPRSVVASVWRSEAHPRPMRGSCA